MQTHVFWVCCFGLCIYYVNAMCCTIMFGKVETIEYLWVFRVLKVCQEIRVNHIRNTRSIGGKLQIISKKKTF